MFQKKTSVKAMISSPADTENCSVARFDTGVPSFTHVTLGVGIPVT